MARRPKVPLPPIPAGSLASAPRIPGEEKIRRLRDLEAEVQEDLAPFFTAISTRVVFGEGDPDAPVLFVGEGPGVEEDRTGRPFVGRSGQLLDKMILAMGLSRERVYITNIVKLRAADLDPVTEKVTDRPPTAEEVARGLPYLHRQIEILQPQVIVTLGAPAVKHLIQYQGGNLAQVRGTWLSYRELPVMPTYHPAYLLRSYTPENRRKVWEDLKKVMERLAT